VNAQAILKTLKAGGLKFVLGLVLTLVGLTFLQEVVTVKTDECNELTETCAQRAAELHELDALLKRYRAEADAFERDRPAPVGTNDDPFATLATPGI
jgi:predicted methyltransferase